MLLKNDGKDSRRVRKIEDVKLYNPKASKREYLKEIMDMLKYLNLKKSK